MSKNTDNLIKQPKTLFFPETDLKAYRKEKIRISFQNFNSRKCKFFKKYANETTAVKASFNSFRLITTQTWDEALTRGKQNGYENASSC